MGVIYIYRYFESMTQCIKRKREKAIGRENKNTHL